SFCALRLSSAIAYVGLDDLLQIIDVVSKDAVHMSHFRIYVARNGNIDEEHGAVLATMHEQLAVLPPEDRMRSPGRGNHNVGAVGGLIKPIEVDGAATDFVCHLLCAFMRPVSDQDCARSVGMEMACRQLAHFSSADQINATSLQAAEDLLCKFHRDRRHRHCRTSDGRFCTHTFGD